MTSKRLKRRSRCRDGGGLENFAPLRVRVRVSPPPRPRPQLTSHFRDPTAKAKGSQVEKELRIRGPAHWRLERPGQKVPGPPCTPGKPGGPP